MQDQATRLLLVPEPPRDRLVGRGGELQRLTRAVRDARGGRGSLVTVSGPSGIGKSRLLRALEDIATAHEMATWWGRCWTGPGAPPLWPWAQIVASAVETLPDPTVQALPEQGRRMLAGLVPDARIRLGVRPFRPATSPPTAAALGAAVIDLLTLACSHRPGLVLLDDAHAADAWSLGLVDHLVDRVTDLPVLVVVGHRTGQGDHHDADDVDRATARARRVELAPLPPHHASELADELADVDLSPEARSAIVTLAAGNPFWLGELARELSQCPSGESVPPAARQFIRRRLDALDAAARDVLEATAVAGGSVDATLVGTVLGVASSAVHGAARLLVDARLLERDGVHRHRLVHDLIREAVLDLLDADREMILHLACADALEARHGRGVTARAVAIARHRVAAGPLADPVDTAERLLDAARFAAGRTAYGDAVDLVRDALSLLEAAGGHDRRQLDALLFLGDLQTRGPGPAGAMATLEEAAEVARQLDDPVRHGRAVLGLTRAYERAPGFEIAGARFTAEVSSALGWIDRSGVDDPGLRAQLLGRAIRSQTLSGLEPVPRSLADEVADEAVRSGDAAIMADAADSRRWTMLAPTPLAERREATAAMLAAATASGDLERQWRAQRWRLLDALECGDPTEVAVAIERSGELATLLHEPYAETLTRVWRTTLALLQGRFEDVRALSQEALEHMAEVGVGAEAVGGQLLYLSRDLGTVSLDGIDAIATAHPTQMVFRALRAWGYAQAGRPAEARGILAQVRGAGLDRTATSGYFLSTCALTAEAAAICQDRASAVEVQRLLRPWSDQSVVAGGGPIVWSGPVAHYLGLCAMTLDEHDEAITHFEAAEAIERRMSGRPMLGRTLLGLGTALRRRGGRDDVARAGSVLAEVEEIGTALGMPGLLRHLELALADTTTQQSTDRHEGPDIDRRAHLRRDGEGWTVGLGGRSARLPDLKGLAFIRRLVAAPGRAHHVLELVGTDGHAPQLDLDQERARYLALSQELEAARAARDDERACALRIAIEDLEDILLETVGAAGSADRAAAAERARVNVTRNISTALSRIEEEDAHLAAHLRGGIRTGRMCLYEPDPTAPVTWDC